MAVATEDYDWCPDSSIVTSPCRQLEAQQYKTESTQLSGKTTLASHPIVLYHRYTSLRNPVLSNSQIPHLSRIVLVFCSEDLAAEYYYYPQTRLALPSPPTSPVYQRNAFFKFMSLIRRILDMIS